MVLALAGAADNQLNQRPICMASRRGFLRQSSTLTAAALITPSVAWARPVLRPNRQVALGQIRCVDFARWVHTPFVVGENGTALAILTLVEVAVEATPMSQLHLYDAGNEKFSLRLRSRSGPRLPQNTYEFAHPAAGSFLMFIVPLSTIDPGRGDEYEAIFNRPLAGRPPNL